LLSFEEARQETRPAQGTAFCQAISHFGARKNENPKKIPLAIYIPRDTIIL
jgi:hypothetical protein